MLSILVFLSTATVVAQQSETIRLSIPYNGVYEGEYHFKIEKPARVQGMAHYGEQWSRNAHLLWDGKQGDVLRLPFKVRFDSKYEISIRLTKAPDYGICNINLDGKKLSESVDCYAGRVELAPLLKLGIHPLTKGVHYLELNLAGANAQARPFKEKGRYLLGVDYLKVVDLESDRISQPVALDLVHADYQELYKTIKTYCSDCHHAERREGKIDLESLTTADSFLANLQVADKVIQALQAGEMPPEGAQQLSLNEKSKLVLGLQNYVDQRLAARQELSPTVMRRLNRLEYNNAVVELLGLKGDIYPLPEKVIRSEYPYFQPIAGLMPDTLQLGNRTLGKNVIEKPILSGVFPFAADLPAEYGFNNRGEELSISALQLETFVNLAQAVVHAPEFNQYCDRYVELFVPIENKSLADTARSRLERIMEKAFRMPVDESLLKRYLQFFESRLHQTDDFQLAMKDVVAAVLSSPRFLYLIEQTPAGSGRQKLTDYELATRLSIFLWNSIPDDKLLALAKSGKLSEPQVLERQVREMLLDPRSQALSQNFARQWLRLDQLVTAVPDSSRFANYYSRIGCEYWKLGLQSMLEPLLLFESIIIEDRPIIDLIHSDYTYRSDELQQWYRADEPFTGKGERNRFLPSYQQFNRIELDDKREGGVITTAAVLTMTSSPLRTNPITRGAWVAGVIFNRPPPPPPDVVPEIEEDDAVFEAQGLTLRQVLKKHQVNQSCKSCHARIDPLGFVLENYDAVGRWRDKYRGGLEIDAGGELFGDVKFHDIVSFKEALLGRPEVFTRAFSEHMLSYALGRQLEVSDKLAVDTIVRNVLANEGRFSSVVVGIATSYPFRHKQAVDPPVGDAVQDGG
ncbi:MAG: DUF1592 domain-containing protein [Planctomycetaceae bacterium]